MNDNSAFRKAQQYLTKHHEQQQRRIAELEQANREQDKLIQQLRRKLFDRKGTIEEKDMLIERHEANMATYVQQLKTQDAELKDMEAKRVKME